MTSLRDLQLEKLRRIFSAFKSMGVYQVIGIVVTIALGLGIYAFKSDTFSSTCDSTKMSSDSKNPENYKEAKSIYEFSAKDIHGEDVSLEKYKGHVCIIVNVASQCGFTKNNYAELSELYQQYGESQGLRILAFPCNQFGNQEPGTNAEICEFVKTKNVDFDMFEKINVNGDNSHPLWNYLKYKQGGILGNFIKWNFTKFIIDKNGQPVERHGPSTNPKDLVKALQKYW